MAVNPSGTLASLLRQTTLDDHEHILGQANDILRQSPHDLHAQHIRVVALLKLDRYDEALDVLNGGNESLKNQAQLAWAYALYKTGRMTEAEEVIAQSTDQARGLKHVEAQVAYRAERFVRAAKLYHELFTVNSEGNAEASDLRVNIGAANAQLLWAGRKCDVQATKVSSLDLKQFETAFNVASCHIAQGNLKQAEFLLNKASDLCRGSDDLSAEEKMAELLAISVQQLYVFSRLGKTAEAERLARSLDISRIEDLSTRHIAQVNVFVASPDLENQYLWARYLDAFGSLPLMESAFNFQAAALNHNRQAINLLMGKRCVVSKATQSHLNAEKRPSILPEVAKAGALNAAASSRGQAGKAVIQQLLVLFGERPNDVGLLLTIVQLYLTSNDIASATSLFEAFFAKIEAHQNPAEMDVRFAPGLVAVLVSLYSKIGRSAHVKAELIKAAAHWLHSSNTDETDESLFKQAATLLLQEPTVNELQTSHELFERIQSRDQSNSIIAGLSASTTFHSDTGNSQDRVLPLKDLVAGITVAELEKAGVPRLSQLSSGMTSRKRAAFTTTPRAGTLKKARIAKLSQSYDPSVQPDPERWLPLRDRSNWKPKGKKKGRATGGMSTQGGMVSEDSRPVTPMASQVVQQANTKKKKGKGSK